MARASGGSSGSSAAVVVTPGDRLVSDLTKGLPTRSGPNGVERAEWNEIESALLEVARRQANDIAALEAQLEADGLIVTGSKGQSRMSPIVTELRLSRQALVRVLAELRMPDAGPLKNAAKQRAARARWNRDA